MWPTMISFQYTVCSKLNSADGFPLIFLKRLKIRKWDGTFCALQSKIMVNARKSSQAR